MIAVRPGQIWADNDKRAEGRTVRIERVDGDRVLCRVLTNSTDTQAQLDAGSPWVRDRRGKTTSIRLDRFKPTNTGYRLIHDTTEETR
ncbi:hypothetical protein ACFY4C_20535 [Actinomadura viridis]|uniref:hypothetical protein n=1 Tax=Actinomadura viridis TaxID=58110 RepID=UPI0036AB193C